MFTWECPKCGKELDVGTVECPVCHPESVATPPRRTQETPPLAAAARQPAPPPKPALSSQPAAAVKAPAPTPASPAAASRSQPAIPSRPTVRPPAAVPSGSAVRPAHLALVGVVLAVAVGLALYFSRPELFRGAAGLQLEDVPEAAGSGTAGSAAAGNLQVAGIRPYYDGEYQPRVRALIINHGDAPVAQVNLEVTLQTPRAPAFAAPLASFVIDTKELGSGESREIETGLTALGTLASLPPWDQVRIQIRDLLQTELESASGTGTP